MERTEVAKQINDIFIDTLDNPDIILTDKTVASDIEEWDSLSHILLVTAIEKHFKIRFSSKEIRNWVNVGEMIDSTIEKVPK